MNDIIAGDFINFPGWFPDVWGEVAYLENKIPHVYFAGSVIPVENTRAIHKKDDPWDYKECGAVFTSVGWLSASEGTLPVKFRYQGTYRLEPVTWYYRGTTPSVPGEFSEYCKKAGGKESGIAASELKNVIHKIETFNLYGWAVIVKEVPEQVFGKTKIL